MKTTWRGQAIMLGLALLVLPATLVFVYNDNPVSERDSIVEWALAGLALGIVVTAVFLVVAMRRGREQMQSSKAASNRYTQKMGVPGAVALAGLGVFSPPYLQAGLAGLGGGFFLVYGIGWRSVLKRLE
jgi:O-antigen/teichoic acid export membrane protein